MPRKETWKHNTMQYCTTVRLPLIYCSSYHIQSVMSRGVTCMRPKSYLMCACPKDPSLFYSDNNARGLKTKIWNDEVRNDERPAPMHHQLFHTKSSPSNASIQRPQPFIIHSFSHSQSTRMTPSRYGCLWSHGPRRACFSSCQRCSQV